MSVADIPAAPPATGFARRHAWLAVLVVGAALFIAEERTLVATQNPNLVPSAILLGASIVPLAFVAFVYGRRLPYRVAGLAVATSAFLGGVIGTIVAATLEFDVLRDLGGLPMLGVGLIEETSKLLVPLALLIPLRHYRTRADGLLIGVACGAGFAALETMGYAFTTLIKSGGDITDTVDILLLRGFLSPAGHMAWTGIAAAALYAAAATRRRREILQFVGAFVGRRGPAHPVGQPELADRHRGRRDREPRPARVHRAPRGASGRSGAVTDRPRPSTPRSARGSRPARITAPGPSDRPPSGRAPPWRRPSPRRNADQHPLGAVGTHLLVQHDHPEEDGHDRLADGDHRQRRLQPGRLEGRLLHQRPGDRGSRQGVGLPGRQQREQALAQRVDDPLGERRDHAVGDPGDDAEQHSPRGATAGGRDNRTGRHDDPEDRGGG